MDKVANRRPRFQDRGVVLGVDTASAALIFATQNAGHFFSDGSIAPGRQISEFLGGDLVHELRNAEAHPSLDRRRRDLGIFDFADIRFEAAAYRSDHQLIVEVMPCSDASMPTVHEILQDAEFLSESLTSHSTENAPFDKFITVLKTLSGYQGVVLERFGPTSPTPMVISGTVEDAGLPCLPPRQLHFVQDVDDATTGIEGGQTLPEFGLSGLISPSEEHLDAWRSAGVVAGASLGLWRGDAPWGVIKFFHPRPRVPNRRTRIALELLTPLLEQRLLNLPK